MIRRCSVLILLVLLLSGTVCVFGADTEPLPLWQYLSVRWARSPDFAPNGQDILFMTNITGVPQVWTARISGGWPEQITFDTNGVSYAVWSPIERNRLLVAADRGGNERDQLYFVDPRGGAWERLTKNDNAIYQFGDWTQDGRKISYASNERDASIFDIYVLDVATRQARMIHQGDGHWVASNWSPDGRYLGLLKNYSNANSDLYIYDSLTTEVKLMTAHEGDALFSGPRWLPDSKSFYFTSNLGRQFVGLDSMHVDSGKSEWVETPDWDVETVAVSRDGFKRAWTVNVQGYLEFHLLNAETGVRVRPYRLPKSVVRGLKFSPDSKSLLITLGSGKEPDDIYLYSIERDQLTPFTRSARGGILPETFVKPELVQYATFDNRQIPAFFYKPPVSQGKMPVIVYVHGGPESQARPNFSGLFQYFVSRGYAVCEPNIRGSTGYGRDYMRLDDIEKRMDAVKDVEYGARWLVSQKDIDPKRLIIFGDSYGGFLVLSSLATYPERWAAGADLVGISNFISFLQNTGPWRRALREAEYGSLAKDTVLLKEISPLTHVDNIRAPLFIVQGANDPRVPKSEADQIYEAVKARGIPVEYIVFPDEGHGIAKLSNRIHAYTRMVEFLDEHVTRK